MENKNIEYSDIQKIFGKKACWELIKRYSQNPDLYQIESIYLKQNFSKKWIQELQKLKLKNQIKIKKELDSMVKENHQGIIIIYRERKDIDIPLKKYNWISRPPKKFTYSEALRKYPGVYILTDRIQDPHNLGSIIRAVESLGASGLLITGKGTRINDTARKVATSSLLYLPVYELSNGHTVVREAKKYDYWIIATTTKNSDKTIFLDQIHILPKEKRYLLLIGSEGEGLKPILLQSADYWLQIPLLGYTQSLNVSQALAIILYKLIEYIK